MEKINVDKKDIAAVIGKGGATIREIVEKSGLKEMTEHKLWQLLLVKLILL